ncbi:MAG TPA: hypothetical protein VID47_15785 [Actinomycetota bacterium]
MSLGDQIRVPAAVARPDRAMRGRVWLYAIAFLMLLVAGWLQVKGNLNSNLEQVWWAIALSIGAVVVAVVSVLVPGRRTGSTDDATPAATGDGSGEPAAGSDPGPSSTDSEPSDDSGPSDDPEPLDVESGPHAEADEKEADETGSDERPPPDP